MSLDKAILHGKEHRKPWYDARAWDPWCRNHGNDSLYINRILRRRLLKGRYLSKLKLKEGLKEYYASLV